MIFQESFVPILELQQSLPRLLPVFLWLLPKLQRLLRHETDMAECVGEFQFVTPGHDRFFGRPEIHII